MNLIINDTCNRACPYCFARSKVGLSDGTERPDGKDISLDNFERYLDFLARGAEPLLKLLGGEPTLHPEFLELLRRAHARGLQTLVFTNGLWPRKVREGIQAIPLAEWKLKFLFNVNEPRMQPASQLERVMECVKIAGPQGQCGFNIYCEDFDLQFIPDLIDAAGMDREVRLGLAAPIFGTDNSFIEPENFKALGLRLLDQLRKLEERNVIAFFDCGFPLCMFPEDDLGSLTLITRGFRSVCSYPIDVGPDLMAWPCFPLSKVENLPLLDFADLSELRERFTRQLAGMRRFGTLDACLGCKYLERQQCNGGCVAHTLKNWASHGDQDVMRKISGIAASSVQASA